MILKISYIHTDYIIDILWLYFIWQRYVAIIVSNKQYLTAFQSMALWGGPPKEPYIGEVITWLSAPFEAKFMYWLSSFHLSSGFLQLFSKTWLSRLWQDWLLVCYSSFRFLNMAISKQKQLFTQYFFKNLSHNAFYIGVSASAQEKWLSKLNF